MLAIARRLRRDDSGITLVELLVAISLFSLLLVIVASFYVSSMTVVALGRELTGNTKSVTNGMNEASRVIRAGTENPLVPPAQNDPAFVIAEPDDVVIYAYINLSSSAEQPQLIRLRVDRTTGKFIESRWPATQLPDKRWSFPANPCKSTNVPVGCTAPTSTSVLSETISPQGSGPQVFTFLSKTGDPIQPLVAGGPLNLAQRRLISSVKISLPVQTSLTDDSNPVRLENTVGMPNLGFVEESS